MAPLRGKKAWRKNISTAQEEEVLAEESHQERRGPVVETLKDEQLFFMDTSADSGAALAAAAGKRKRVREVRPLKSQLILAEAHAAKPVPLVPARKKQPIKADALLEQLQREVDGQKAGRTSFAYTMDLWADDSATKQALATSYISSKMSLARGIHTSIASSRVERPIKKSKKCLAPANVSRIPAVEVDQGGCSYNPDKEQHQDALAVLVAAEMRKMLKKELEPTAPLPYAESGAVQMSELERLQVDMPETDEDENEIELGSAAAGSSGADATGSRTAESKKKTKQDRNKQQRRKAEEKHLEERRLLKKMRGDLDQLHVVAAAVEEEAEQQQLRQERKEAVREERAVSRPPRLGKLKFEPQSVQVLVTEDVTGSLRQIRASPMMATERYKSLQKRGLIEPRRPRGVQQAKKQVMYEKNHRAETAAAGQAELDQMVAARKSAARQAKSQKAKNESAIF
ncbi:MAG: hypothetical protein WDW38_005704 [Sanguina aurantia]